eukprot:2603380-Amphidinium_carterae.1
MGNLNKNRSGQPRFTLSRNGVTHGKYSCEPVASHSVLRLPRMCKYLAVGVLPRGGWLLGGRFRKQGYK